MTKIRITKEFNFEMAHALFNYNGACKNIHGHSYRLFVTVMGTPINDMKNHENGMVIDFNKLKQIVKENIINDFDHAIVLFDNIQNQNLIKQIPAQKNVLTKYQPTCENMLIDFANRIIDKLPQNISLFSLKLQETITSVAEWYANDNK